MAFLVCHPDAPAGAIQSIDAELDRTPDGAVATFTVTGDIDRLVLSPAADSRHTDELWKTTCFELFVEQGGTAYREYNFAPSGAWAAYDFDDYRAGMRAAEVGIEIETRRNDNGFILIAKVRPEFPNFARVGLSAVIEESDGHRRYWATSFAPGKADFHAEAVRCLILDGVSAE